MTEPQLWMFVPRALFPHAIAWRQRSPKVCDQWERIEGRLSVHAAEWAYDEGRMEMATGRVTDPATGIVVEVLYALPRKVQELRPRYFGTRAA